MFPLFNNHSDRLRQLSWRFRKLRRKWRNHWLYLPIFIPVSFYEQIRLGIFPRIHLQLLNTRSPKERMLYYKLYSIYGHELKSRYSISRYQVDIAIPKYKLALDCDGEEFIHPKKQLLSQKKKHELAKHGWKLMRFSPRRLSTQADQIIREITEYTNIAKKRKHPGQST